MAEAQDRNLPASERKKSKARKDGQVARSRDLGHLAVIGGGSALVIALMPRLVDTLRKLLAAGLSFDAAQLAEGDVMLRHLMSQGVQMLLLVLPMGAAVLLAALAAGKLCGGWNFTMKPLQPKFEKLNPLTGVTRLLSKNQLIETLKSCLLAAVLLAIGGSYVWQHMAEFTG
jgi:flagellar biosynthetic protein FlhB